jgi:hypothetical protein
MTNEWDDSQERGRDEVWPGMMQWNLGAASAHGAETLWRCNALRAGKLYSRSLFATQAEAEQFAVRMRDAEPDQMFNVEAIKASAVWN